MLLPTHFPVQTVHLKIVNWGLLGAAWLTQIGAFTLLPHQVEHPWLALAVMTLITTLVTHTKLAATDLQTDLNLVISGENLTLLCFPAVFTPAIWFDNFGLIGTLILLVGLRSAHAPTYALLGLLVRIKWPPLPRFSPVGVPNFARFNLISARLLVSLGFVAQIAALVSMSVLAMIILSGLVIWGCLIWQLTQNG